MFTIQDDSNLGVNESNKKEESLFQINFSIFHWFNWEIIFKKPKQKLFRLKI